MCLCILFILGTQHILHTNLFIVTCFSFIHSLVAKYAILASSVQVKPYKYANQDCEQQNSNSKDYHNIHHQIVISDTPTSTWHFYTKAQLLVATIFAIMNVCALGGGGRGWTLHNQISTNVSVRRGLFNTFAYIVYMRERYHFSLVYTIQKKKLTIGVLIPSNLHFHSLLLYGNNP